MRPDRRGAHARARFFRRAGIGAGLIAFLAIGGFITGAIWLGRAIGMPYERRGVMPLIVLAVVFLIVRAALSMRRFGSPLWDVMEAADRVADGDYGVRVTESGPPPIRALARSFNTMTERLQDADRQRRDLMADVAHELRTPLTVLQGRIEGLIDGVYPRDQRQLEQLLGETHVLSRLVEDLRTLALSKAGMLPLQKEPTNIVALVRDVARNFSGQHPSIVAPEPAEVMTDIDPVRIREVVSNLIANAIRYTPGDGRITITVDAEAGPIAVTVNDTGQGIAPEQLPRLFDRFHKGVESSGSGLGLAIAKGIVTAHSGEISATSTLGSGTTIRFTLPSMIAE
jgi:two-component system OmpR family sensor kinase/two-component system sensor histidine kinase BaeS